MATGSLPRPSPARLRQTDDDTSHTGSDATYHSGQLSTASTVVHENVEAGGSSGWFHSKLTFAA